MNKFLILSFTALLSVGCQSAASNSATNNNSVANKAVVQSANVSGTQSPNNSAVVSSHSETAENPAPPTANAPAKSTESPMARPIDVAAMTANIEQSEKEYKTNPAAKENLAKAYFTRATALTEAAQYRAALGDYRRGLKLDPNDEAAKGMHDQILSIFKQINREPPKEGDEPKPLPFK